MSILASLNRIVRPGGSRSAAKSAGTIDNRVAPRLPRVSTAQLLQYPAGRHQHPIEVQVTDYSETGIGIIYHEGLIIGRTFVVREPHVTHGKTCSSPSSAPMPAPTARSASACTSATRSTTSTTRCWKSSRRPASP
jgi:hypothetical protein